MRNSRLGRPVKFKTDMNQLIGCLALSSDNVRRRIIDEPRLLPTVI